MIEKPLAYHKIWPSTVNYESVMCFSIGPTWQQGLHICFANFLMKNQEIADNPTYTGARDKISTYLEFLVF